MTPEEKSLLERTYKLAEENNGMLKSIRRTGRLALIMRGIYWVIILGASIGAYYFIQPYINSLLGFYGSLSGLGGSSGAASQFSNFFK